MKYTKCQTKISIDPLVMGIMNENNPLMLDILNHLIYLSTRFQKVFVSQGTLAAKFGATRQWINELLRRWKALGVIKYRQQDFNRSCIYLINPLLAQEKNRIKFKLPAAVLLLSISSLCSAVYQQELTLSNIRNLSNYKMVTIPEVDYGFYEPREAESIVFLKNKQQTTINSTITSKERVMDAQQTVINRLSDTYGLSVSQQDMLSNYSEEALQYAFNELKRQNKQNSLNNPVNWIAKVAAAYKGKAQQFPKRGNAISHTTTATNPKGHSPAQELPNLSHMEQIEYLMNEILNFSKTFDPSKVYSRDPQTDESLKKLAMNSIAGMQREVDKLLALLDDATHTCKTGCVDQSLFLRLQLASLRKPNQQTDVDFMQPSADKDYEDHLQVISEDKSNSAGYKELIRRYDYQRLAR